MSSSRMLVVAAALAAVVGCDRSPTAPSTVHHFSPSSGPMFDQVGSEARQSVSGHYEFVGINTGNDFKYSLTAIRHADLTVSGEVEERTTFGGRDSLVRSMHGTVTCFVISGNTAFIAGIVDRVVSYAAGQENLVPGAGFRLVVVDNGNGANDPPDMGSNARFGLPASSQAFCNAPFTFNLEPIDHGNIDIHP
jgi:hypothetical protein